MTDASLGPIVTLEPLRALARTGASARALDAAELRALLGLEGEYLARLFLRYFDRDGDGRVPVGEILAGLEALESAPVHERLRFAFELHDHDRNGFVERSELERLFSISLAESRIELSGADARALVDGMFAHADADGDGRISFAEFCAMVNRHAGVRESLSHDAVAWLKPTAPLAPRPSVLGRMRGRGLALRQYAQNRAPLAVGVALYAGATAAVCVDALVRYGAAGANGWVLLARAAGAALDLNLALVLVPTFRALWTRVRRTAVGRVLPLDHAVDAHKVVGHAIAGFSALHAAAHVGNYATGPLGLEALWTTRAGATGAAMLALLAVLWVCAQRPVRRAGRFELFWFTHLLYAPFVVLALVHADTIWPWLAGPAVALVLDRLARARRTTRRAELAGARVLPSGVTRLEVHTPAGFAHRPGDYVFLRVPAVARHEWHPFTISSAPEQRESFTVHVRRAGDWTSALHALVVSGRAVRGGGTAGRGGGAEVYVDGPYGTPSAHIFDSPHPVLIGGGIGVTPFAAILDSLAERLARNDATLRVRRVHFVWVARDQRAFEWFAALLGRIERSPQAHMFDLRIFHTSARADVSSATLRVAMDLLYARTQTDAVTGLQSRTRLGHPDWDAILADVAREHAGEPVDVYFCGPRGLSRTVRHSAERLGMRFREERF